jgi:hypothetical protein
VLCYGRMQPPTQYTIPSTAVEKLAYIGRAMLSLADEIKAHQGETAQHKLEFPIPNLTPTGSVPSQQAWFWTEAWQAGEREVNAALEQGAYVVFTSADDLIADLHRSV